MQWTIGSIETFIVLSIVNSLISILCTVQLIGWITLLLSISFPLILLIIYWD